MAYQYKIFKCNICNDPCYYLIKEEETIIEKTDLHNCVINNTAPCDWGEIKESELFNIKNIINKLI